MVENQTAFRVASGGFFAIKGDPRSLLGCTGRLRDMGRAQGVAFPCMATFDADSVLKADIMNMATFLMFMQDIEDEIL